MPLSERNAARTASPTMDGGRFWSYAEARPSCDGLASLHDVVVVLCVSSRDERIGCRKREVGVTIDQAAMYDVDSHDRKRMKEKAVIVCC